MRTESREGRNLNEAKLPSKIMDSILNDSGNQNMLHIELDDRVKNRDDNRKHITSKNVGFAKYTQDENCYMFSDLVAACSISRTKNCKSHRLNGNSEHLKQHLETTR